MTEQVQCSAPLWFFDRKMEAILQILMKSRSCSVSEWSTNIAWSVLPRTTDDIYLPPACDEMLKPYTVFVVVEPRSKNLTFEVTGTSVRLWHLLSLGFFRICLAWPKSLWSQCISSSVSFFLPFPRLLFFVSLCASCSLSICFKHTLCRHRMSREDLFWMKISFCHN